MSRVDEKHGLRSRHQQEEEVKSILQEDVVSVTPAPTTDSMHAGLDAEYAMLELAADAVLASLGSISSRLPTGRKHCDDTDDDDDDGMSNELNKLGSVVNRLRADLDQAQVSDWPRYSSGDKTATASHVQKMCPANDVQDFLCGSLTTFIWGIVVVFAVHFIIMSGSFKDFALLF